MTATQIISLKILAALADGMPLPQAVDSVLGDGTYDKLAGELWELFQSK